MGKTKFKMWLAFVAITVCVLSVYLMTQNMTEARASANVGASTVVLNDGDVFDLSGVKGATYLNINKAGSYTVKGSSNKVMMTIDVPKGSRANVIFDGVTLAPTGAAPGASVNPRSAIEIEENGGDVHLISKSGTFTTIQAKGNRPAIRKDGTNTSLTFATTDPANPGTFDVHADNSAYRTCAIGCYSSLNFPVAIYHTTGNMTFESGNVNAYGSSSKPLHVLEYSYGGAGIGADGFGSVNGITIKGGHVRAVGGDASAAGIGTSSAHVDGIIESDTFVSTCKNIRIEGGTVEALQARNDVGSTAGTGGAAIGGGRRSDTDGIYISGGKVTATAGYYGTGIGGGMDANGVNIRISGGDVIAKGGSTGIGGGASFGEVEGPDVPDISGTGKSVGESKSYGYYGNGKVYISGGNVTAVATDETDNEHKAAVGIGGWKRDATDGEVIISGGSVNVKSNGTGIGTTQYGALKKVEITGGTVNVQTGNEGAAIGTQIFNLKWAESTVKMINITGGTVYLDAADPEGACLGGKSESAFYVAEYKPTPVYISGGNVICAGKGEIIHKGVIAKNRVNGDEVYPYTLTPAGYDSGRCTMTSFKDIINDSSGNEREYSYGLHDVTFYGDQTSLCFWLPKNQDYAKLEITPQSSTAKLYTGMVSDAKRNNMLYPQMGITLKGNTTGATDGTSAVYQGYTKANFVNSPAREGYTVEGYYGNIDCTVKIMDTEGNFVKDFKDITDSRGRWIGITNDNYKTGVTFYTKWDEASYKVHYDPNRPETASTDLTGAVAADATLKYSQTGTVNSGSIALPGYTLAGWNTKADGSGTSYAAGDTFSKLSGKPDDTVTLYAQWKPKTYKIVFNKTEDSATGTMDAQVCSFDSTVKLNANKFACDGKIFTGWNIKNVIGSMYVDESNVENLCRLPQDDGSLSDVELEAIWRNAGVTVITVLDNGNMEAGLANDLSLTSNGSTYVGFGQAAAGIYELSGFIPGTYNVNLKGFNTAGKILNVGNDGGGMLSLEYCTVNAVSGDHCTTTLQETSGTAQGSKTKTRFPVGDKLKVKTVTDPGYYFESYTENGIDPVFEDGREKSDQLITVNGKVDIESHAAAAVYHVKFDPNDETYPEGKAAKGSMETQDMVYDEPQHLFTNGFIKKGYRLTGWNTKADGSGTSYAAGEEVQNLTTENDADITLYARWDRYAATLSGFEGKAVVSGRDMAPGEKFSFGISAADDATKNAVSDGDIELPELSAETMARGKDGEAVPFAFGDIVFNKEGTYKFDVRQTDPHMSGLQCDESIKEITVDAVWEGDVLTAAVKGITSKTVSADDMSQTDSEAVKGLEFTNIYRASGAASISASQLLTRTDIYGKKTQQAIKKGTFTYEARYARGKDTTSVIARGTNTRGTSTSPAGVYFPNLFYATQDAQSSETLKDLEAKGAAVLTEENGQQVYTIPYVITQRSAPAGIRASAQKFIVTVKVAIDPDSYLLDVTTTYDHGAKFVNKYKQKAILAKAIAKGSGSIKVSWIKVAGASKYTVYASKCATGDKMTRVKKAKTLTAGHTAWTKRFLKEHMYYKFKVYAYDKAGRLIGKSVMLHSATGGYKGAYGNTKKIYLSKKAITIRTGKAVKFAKIVKKIEYSQIKNKRYTNKDHCATYRYLSGNTDIMKVSPNGTLLGRTKGSCKLYLQAPNGLWKTVSVFVK